jgi:hypothetical protein
MLTENERIMWESFRAIAVLEHHQMIDPVLDIYDICDQLHAIWLEVRREAEASTLTLDADCAQNINERIARSFGRNAGIFRDKEGFSCFVDECGSVEEDPSHVCSWIFSALYWNYLTQFRLSTAWLFVNAIRIQHKLPEYKLKRDRLGAFLESLSGSGPPLYDGQTFDPGGYSS